MSLLSRFREGTPAGPDPEVELLRESMADLELALEDSGWQRISGGLESEFSREGLANAAKVARVMAVAHPLIKRGLGVRQAYVFGQGVTVTARADGDEGAQDVNAVIQAFWDDEGNRAALTGDQAQEEGERALGTDGNFFIACFTNPSTGFVQARTIPFDEIVDIITNPDDRAEPWYYRRRWVARAVTPEGRLVDRTEERFYPAINYRPGTRPKTLDGYEVQWDAPIAHVKVNGLTGWAFGIGDAYAALPYARAYRDFLADWAQLVKALSQFAFRATTKGSRAQKLREQLVRRQAAQPRDGSSTAGATAVMGDDVSLEAIPKSGATIDSESGKPLAAMIGAALDVPVTWLLADPGQTGARAVAETLNMPTLLAMMQRQSVWAAAYRSILDYVVKQAVKAPQGPLTGTVTRDPFTRREVITLGDATDAAVEITFPPLDELPLKELIDAIKVADDTGKVPPVEVARMLLNALKVPDVDEVMKSLVDADGNFIDPAAASAANAAAVAVARFRAGGDSAEVV